MDLSTRTLADAQPAPSPAHCEAFPSFSIEGVSAWWRSNVRFCEWFCEQGGIAAQMDVLRYDQTDLTVLYSCGDDTYRHQRQAMFTIRMMMQISRRLAPRVACPECHRLVLRIFYRFSGCACQRCHGLVERRSLLNPFQKLIVKRDKLIAQVHASARPARSSAANDRARYQLIRVMRELGDPPPRLDQPLRHMLTPWWFNDPDERTEIEPHDYMPAYLDG